MAARSMLLAAAGFLVMAAPAALAADLNLTAELSGASVVSATESKGSGQAVVSLADDGTVTLDAVFAGLAAEATSVELLLGKSSENGVLIGPLAFGEGKTADSVRGLTVSLTPEQEQAMRDGQTYLVVRTIDYPAGAIRGQLVPQSAVTLGAPVTPQDEDKTNNSDEPSTNR